MGRRASGFTLIELIIVMIVIFTLAAVIAPRFSDFFPSFQVKKSTEHLLGWARKARADAAITGFRQRLILDSKNRKFWLEYEARPMKEPGKFTMLSGAWGEEQLPEGVDFEQVDVSESTGAPVTGSSGGDVKILEFRPDGSSTEATVILSNDNGDRLTVRVEGATSKVYIKAAEDEHK
ncbi:MAG TPA: prepilin-type N-terminal cleavage/methylation domain-containing protein [Planctomycetota bacterium]|nr:prepilin-type N-terminal cleavage/methylation domain-containing protein [Planctomycetota bacterium]